jgi:uncharacterized membrane protein YhdT
MSQPKYDFEEDPRYHKGALQALWIGIIYVIYCVGAIIIAFPLSIYRPQNMPMKFIGGFPDWVFWSIIVWPLVMSLVTILVILLKFKEIDLGPLGEPEVKEVR